MNILRVVVISMWDDSDEPWEKVEEIPDFITDERLLMLIGYGLAFESDWDGGDDNITISIYLNDRLIHKD